MAPYENIRPDYVRDWLAEKKTKWMGMITDRINLAKERGEIAEETKIPEVRLSTKEQLKALGINVNLSDGLDDLNDSVGNVSTGLDDLDID